MCLSVVSIAYKKASRIALHLSSRFPVPGPARIRIGCEEWAPWSRPATQWCSHSYGPMVLILVLIRFTVIILKRQKLLVSCFWTDLMDLMACISMFPYISCMFMFISRELWYDCLSLCFPHLARNGKDATAKAPRQQYPGLQQSPDAAPDQSSARCQRFLKCAKTHIYEDNVLEYSEVSRTFQNYSQHFTTIPNYPYLYHNYPDCIKHIEHSKQCPDAGGTPAMACARLMEDACLDKRRMPGQMVQK